MLESVFVYGLLTGIMVLCGVMASQREPAYVEGSGQFYPNRRFLRPEILLIIASFAFVFGCRWGVGVDFFHYYGAYRFGTDRDFELLFALISNGMSALDLHFAFFFAFWALLEITLLLWAFKNYRFIYI